MGDGRGRSHLNPIDCRGTPLILILTQVREPCAEPDSPIIAAYRTMLPSLKGALIFVLGVIPGVPGESLYSLIVGINQRQSHLRRVTRTLLISAMGLILYVLVGDFLASVGIRAFTRPFHVMPSSFQESLGSGDVSVLAWAYVGHILFSTIAGGIVAGGWHKLAQMLDGQSYPSAWNALIETNTKNRWVVVNGTDGRSYAGIIDTADTDVQRENRGLLLREPARHDPERGGFVATRFQYKFLPAELIRSIDVLAKPTEDERATQAGQKVFSLTDSRVTWSSEKTDDPSKMARGDGCHSNPSRVHLSGGTAVDDIRSATQPQP